MYVGRISIRILLIEIPCNYNNCPLEVVLANFLHPRNLECPNKKLGLPKMKG